MIDVMSVWVYLKMCLKDSRTEKDSVASEGSLRTPSERVSPTLLTYVHICTSQITNVVDNSCLFKNIRRNMGEKRENGWNIVGICAFTHSFKTLPCSQVHVELTVCQVRVLDFCPGGEDPLRLDRGVWCFTFYSFKPIPVCGAGW